VKVVEDTLRESDPLIRLPAAIAFGKLATDPTPTLVALLADKDTGVVKLTIKALGSHGDTRAIAPLELLRTKTATTANQWLGDYATAAIADIKKRHP
jgi:HEAT repeat protein